MKRSSRFGRSGLVRIGERQQCAPRVDRNSHLAPKAEYDALVVGGGFYGCVLARHLRRVLGQRTLLAQASSTLLDRASYVNQARVHHGYHYPRSLLTGYRSRANFDRFVHDYQDCIDDGFTSYYAISRLFSKVTAAQFKLFCERIEAPIEQAPREVRALFSRELIEQVFRVREVVFDALKLRHRLSTELRESGVEIRFHTEATRVARLPDELLEVSLVSEGAVSAVTSRQVFNCTYSRINHLLAASQLPPLPLKHELAELALVEAPEPLRKMGITVMCGPFFSLIPFPPRGLHSLSHVRYTPHCEWHDGPGERHRDAYDLFGKLQKRSQYLQMVKDASRYVPLLSECRYVDSIWEVKTVLPRSEVDDSRPILFKRNHGLTGLTSIMGSKIDTVYDMIDFANTAIAQ